MMGGRGGPAVVAGDQAVRVVGAGGYWVSDDPSHIDVPRVHAWISGESYWAAGRSYEVMARSIEHSLVLGLYAADGAQAGFARLVTDRATFAWLCDVFAGAGHRGRGLGTFLARAATSHPDVAGIRHVLMAEPGRGLYRRMGFGALISPERWMERPGSNTLELWIAPGILEALIPGRMQSHACTAEVPR
jgi:GNAT superfamily N-acetyltransferase